MGIWDSVCAIDTCERSYHPAATLPFRVNCPCVGKPTLLPRVQGLNGVWEKWKRLCSNDHPVLVGVRVFGYGRALLLFCCYVWLRRMEGVLRPSRSLVFICNSAIAMRPFFILFNAVTMVVTIVFNHHPGLQSRNESGALSPVPQSHHAIVR